MKLTVTGQRLSIEKDLTVENSVNIYECEFGFDSAWDGFDKTAVFQLNSEEPIEVVLVDDACLVPHEVLAKNGHLKVGVYGTKDEKVMPTIWGERVLVNLGTPTGSPGTEPTPSIYAQILELANSAKATSLNYIGHLDKDNQSITVPIPQGYKGVVFAFADMRASAACGEYAITNPNQYAKVYNMHGISSVLTVSRSGSAVTFTLVLVYDDYFADLYSIGTSKLTEE